TKNSLYDRGVLRSHRLSGPVISVGNLSAGGSGKTPFVILLGELLKQRGIKFDVLSRGYGRKSKGVRLVNPAGLPQEIRRRAAPDRTQTAGAGNRRRRSIPGRALRRIEVRPAASSAR